MKRTWKIISLVLAVMLLCSIAGCGNSTQSAPQAPAATEAAPAPAAAEPQQEEPAPADPEVPGRSYPYTFTDMAGVEITLDKEVETVYIVGSVQPLVALYRYYRGSSDNLLEVPAASQSIIASSVMAEIWPDMLELKSHTDDANAEEILALNPDVVFMTGSATGDTYEALVNAGLTVVSFPTAGSGDDNDTFETVKNWLNQMAEVFGDSEAADALVSYNTQTLADIDAALANAAEKPKALIIFQLTPNSCRVAGSGHYSEFWLNHSGAENAAAEITKLQEVDIEQLMAWDPDIIYLTTFSPAMPEDLYNNTIEGFDFSQLSAVKNQQVYKIPLGSYRWYAPSCECALMLKWMSSINHPEIFGDMDMSQEVIDFIREFYNYEANADQAAVLLNPSDTSIMSH